MNLEKALSNLSKDEENFTLTENGATALRSTGSSLLDLFGVLSGLRGKSNEYVDRMFIDAFEEDALLTTKMMFFARNIRGGLGERETFRKMLFLLAKLHPEIVLKNLENIIYFGRWDDLYSLINTPVEDAMWSMIGKQLEKDISSLNRGEKISLLSKWLKSINTSSIDSVKLGILTAQKLNYSMEMYRKTLSRLRKALQVVETQMSNNDWNDINYSGVPSLAMKNYRNAFEKHDSERFNYFLSKVESGESTIKAQTFYPYDILRMSILSVNYNFKIKTDRTLEAQWKALPNYVKDGTNILVMADTSSSMYSPNYIPISTAIGLAIYFAERNTGIFQNKLMTFSTFPKFITLNKEDTLQDKVNKLECICSTTNLESAFDMILNAGIKYNVSQEEMPKSLVIISDMQFNQATDNFSLWNTFYNSMVKKFNNAGYIMPNVVFWNVGGYQKTYTANKSLVGVQQFSGFSPAVFKNVLNSIGLSSYDAMLQALNDPQYDRVVV